MPSLIVSERAESDLAKIHDFIAAEDPARAVAAVALILDACEILERHPLIGRIAEGQLRELVVSHGHSGYIGLYWYDLAHDRVVIKAIRHQRDAGFDES